MGKPLDRIDAVAVSGLMLIGAGIPLALAAAAGTIGIPTLDDWLYMQAADGLRQTGTLHMALHSAAVFGQLLLVQPLLWLSAGSTWAFTAFGLLMASIGIACTYLLARRFLGRSSAAMVVLLVVSSPGFLRESASFMTDVPAYALTMVSLLLGLKWSQGTGGGLVFTAALAAGLLAVSIREFAAAAPAALLLVAWARSRPEQRLWLALLTGISALVVWLVVVFASGANRVAPGTPDSSFVYSFAFVPAAFATLMFIVLPALVIFAAPRISTLNPEAAVAALVSSLAVVVAPTGPLLGNVLTASGIGGDLLLAGKREWLFAGRLWPLLEQLAVLAAIVATALVYTWARPSLRIRPNSLASTRFISMTQASTAPLVVFLAIYIAELLAYPAFGPILDRYLYPMVPAAAILLLRSQPTIPRFGRSLALAHATFAFLAVVALTVASNSFAYDAARWRAGQAAVARGFQAGEVDAGYEWVGYHANEEQISSDHPFVLNWYYDVIPADPPCAIVSNSELAGGALRMVDIDEDAYHQYLFLGPAEPFYLYASSMGTCPSLPASSGSAVEH